MESDLEFEREQLAWGKRMMRDFPLSPNLPYYRFLISDSELRIHQLQKKLHTISCASK